MATIVAINGNEAVAQAVRQINPDVVAAYPITPSTAIVEYISKYVADGLIDTEFVTTESEHSALSACVGAAAGGGRVMNATSAQGLALMWEVLYVASGMRLPMVLAVVNRALSAPINIHGDHSDAMGARDSGWIQLFSENCQEAYDNMIQAVRIGEHKDVRLPVIVNLDGFIISHAIETFTMEDDLVVKDFIGDYIPKYPLLDIKNLITYGAIDFPDYYFEHKRQQMEAMKNVKDVIIDVGKEFEQITGRRYGLFESYMLEDAEVAIIVMSSAAGTAKTVVNELRRQGQKVGILRIRTFRPFPALEIAEALSNIKAVAVLDRCGTGGAQGGPLFLEVRSSLYGRVNPIPVINYIYGLGGRDLEPLHIKDVFKRLSSIINTNNTDPLVNYINLRE